MSTIRTTHAQWVAYRDAELARVGPVLLEHGYLLDKEQQHIGGERFLQQAVTTASGRKLILLGIRKSDGLRVVIKATSDPAGIHELKHESDCRTRLERINFAYDTFDFPEVIEEFQKNGLFFTVIEYIEQESTFLERTLREQFGYALRAFKAQESARATTHGHLRKIRGVFETYTSARYVESFDSSLSGIERYEDRALATFFRALRDTLAREHGRIEQYCGFLTHTDFVPHNFRIRDNTIYLLDQSSFRFGNKYEGWARFLNFMTLYHPELEAALVQYVRDNRAPEELEALMLMRLYRLGEIVSYYVQWTRQSEGNLLTLSQARVRFWSDVARAVWSGAALPDEVRDTYIITRDQLRSEDEKKRQVGLH